MIKSQCPTCKTEADFRYIGRQKGFGAVPDFDLYNCETCDSSFANDSLGLELIAESQIQIERNKDNRSQK